MEISTMFFVFLDIAPPEPTQIGAVGYASAIGFGLLFVSLGIICIRLLKKWLPAWLRLGIGLFLLFFGLAGGVSMAISVAEQDAEARRNRPIYQRVPRPNEEREIFQRDADANSANQNSVNKQNKVNNKK